MSPPWMSVSALMQRISVDLPDPEGPMMQITSPFITSMLTPRSTSSAPKLLWTARSDTIGCSSVQVWPSMAPPFR